MRPIEARARQQLGPAAVQAGVHAISVVLDLMQPFQALGRRVHHFATLRLAPLWKAAVRSRNGWHLGAAPAQRPAGRRHADHPGDVIHGHSRILKCRAPALVTRKSRHKLTDR